MAAGVTIDIPPAGRRGSNSVVLADLLVVLEGFAVVFWEPDADWLLLSLVDAEESELVADAEDLSVAEPEDPLLDAAAESMVGRLDANGLLHMKIIHVAYQCCSKDCLAVAPMPSLGFVRLHSCRPVSMRP